MIFITSEHYLSEMYDLSFETNQECFVCFESENGNGTMVRLNEITIFGYEKNCDCNGSIHNKCLAKWYTLQQKCPICRQRMDKTISMDHVRMHSSEFRLTILLLICQRIITFFKMISFLLTLYYFYYYFLFTKKIIDE